MMGHRSRALVVVWTLALLALAPSVAAAPDAVTAKARALFKQAEVHFSLGEFQAALDGYREAYKLKPLPGLLFNIGQCYRHLRQYDRALFFYEQYRIRSSALVNAEEVNQLIEICRKELATQGKKPPPSSRESAELPLLPPASRLPAVEPAGGTEGPAPVAPTGRRRLRPLWFWSGLGLSAALLVTGAVTGGLALKQSSDYQDRDTSIERRRELRDSGTALARTSTATFAVGGAAAAVTAVLYFFTDFGGRERTVAAAPVAGGAALVVGSCF
jgi:tetratricopeptide (TPR) repeat protein